MPTEQEKNLVMAAVDGVDWKGQAKDAGAWTRDRAAEGLEKIKRGDCGLQALCFAGGCALMAKGVLGIVNIFGVLSPFAYLFNVYLFIFGFVMFVYERPDGVSYGCECLETRVRRFQDGVDVWMKIFTSLLGRGFMYFMFGTVVYGSASSFFSGTALVGLYVIFCGVLLLFWNFKVGRQWQQTVDALKSKGTKAAQYSNCFKERPGKNKEQFAAFLEKELGLSFTGEELNSAFNQMDSGHKGYVTFEDFRSSFDESPYDYSSV